MAYLGRKVTASTAFTHNLRRSDAGGEQWGQLFNAPGQYFWVTGIGANMQRNPSASPQKAALALWDGNGPLLGQSGYLTMPSTMASMEADVGTAVLIRSDQTWIAGPVIEQVGGLVVSVSNARLIQRDGSASSPRAFLRADRPAPSNPFGAYSGNSGDGNTEDSRGFAVWVKGQANNPPNAPYDLSMNGVAINTSGSLATTDTTPTFGGRFYDFDETLSDAGRLVFNYGAADKMSAYQVYVTNAAGALAWDSGIVTATGADQTNRLFYATATTLGGGSYTVRMRTRDLAGAWGPEAIAYFTIASATTEAVGTPTGKITDTTPDTFGWRFNNTGGGTADRAQVRLLQNGGIIATSPEIVGTYSPNIDWSNTWAETGFATLQPGGQYSYQVRHRYAGGTVWTNWSPQRTFFLNSPPSAPLVVSPKGGSYGTYPTLQFQIFDVDDDSSVLTVYTQVVRPDGTIVALETGAQSAPGIWAQATTVAVNNQPGAYTFRGAARENWSSIYGPYSAYGTYNFGSYPAVAVSGVTPLVGGVVPSSMPTVSWTTEGTATPTATQQASWQVAIIVSGTTTAAHSSNFVSSQATSYQVPGNILRQGTYDAVVTVTNSVGLTGASSTFTFTIAYTPPAQLTNVSAQPAIFVNDYSNAPTGIRGWFDASNVSPSTFRRYVVNRSDLTQPLAVITNQAQNVFDDPAPPGNANITYSVRQVVIAGIDEIESAPVAVTAFLPITDLVLSDAITGSQDRVVLRYVDSLSEDLVKDEVEILTWESSPTVLQGASEFVRIPVSARIRPNDDPSVDPQAQLAAFRALCRKRVEGDGTKSPRVICLRDATGIRYFGRIGSGAGIKASRNLWLNTLSFTFSEVDFAEGVSTGEAS